MSETSVRVVVSAYARRGGKEYWQREAEQLAREVTALEAEVERLRDIDKAAEKLLLSIRYPMDRLLVVQYYHAKTRLAAFAKEQSE